MTSSPRKPYDYSTRTGIRPVSWNDFHGICKALALSIRRFDPEAILAVGRGGFYPGTLIAHLLRREIYPVRLSRRVNDQVVHESPAWILEPPALLAGKRVLVVDEICGTGETLRMVKARAVERGAHEVRIAVMYAHSWGTDEPDYIGLVSDGLILNPWDREVATADGFVWHPEYAEALQQQGIPCDQTLLIATPTFELAKTP